MANPNPNPVVDTIERLGQQLATQNVGQALTKFKGNPKNYKTWMKEVEKFCLLQNINGDVRKKLIAFQASEGPVSDFIDRYIAAHPQGTFQAFKDELKARFGGVSDESQAMTLLRRLKQKAGETVQSFGERMFTLAEDAFPGQNLDNPIIARQLIEFFVDGLANDGIARKIIREGPANFNAAVVLATREQNMMSRFSLRGRQEEPMEIGMVQAQNTDRKTLVCFSCNKPGHMARDCRSKKKQIRCYHCQEVGHIKKYCTKRQSEELN